MPGLKFVKKGCSLSKKQISAQSRTEWTVKLVDHKMFLIILLGASYTIRAFKYYKAVWCMCYVVFLPCA